MNEFASTAGIDQEIANEMERLDRVKRNEINEKRAKDAKDAKKENDEDDIFRVYKPSEDYQVQQAASLLKGMRFLTQKVRL